MNGKKIRLSQGKFAIVSDRDFARLSKFKWHARRDRNTWYAARHTRKSENRKKCLLYIHREIKCPPAGKDVDHRNGNGLDNRRKNLRIVTHAINCQNRVRLNSNNISGFTGVRWDKNLGKWTARFQKNGASGHIGVFKTKRLAIQARKQFVL